MKKLILIFGVCTIAWLGLGGCGDDDCTVCPDPECSDCPYDGRLYVAMDSPNAGIYIFDTSIDSLIDSVMFESTVLHVSVSKDGRFFAGSNDRGVVYLLDASTAASVTELSGVGETNFGRNSTVFLVRRRAQSDVYSLPTVTLLYSGRAVPSGRQVVDELMFFGLWTADTLALFNVDSTSVVRKWGIKLAELQFLKKFDVSNDGTKLFGVANTSEGDLFYAYDLVRDSVLSEFTLVSYFGDVRVHPEGNEVWVTDPGSPFVYPWPDEIYVFDAHTGNHLYSISLRQSLNPYGAIPDAYGLEFTPDGSAAYVRTGHELSISGTVLRIDCQSKKVTKILFPNWGRYPTSMAVGPKPNSE